MQHVYKWSLKPKKRINSPTHTLIVRRTTPTLQGQLMYGDQTSYIKNTKILCRIYICKKYHPASTRETSSTCCRQRPLTSCQIMALWRFAIFYQSSFAPSCPICFYVSVPNLAHWIRHVHFSISWSPRISRRFPLMTLNQGQGPFQIFLNLVHWIRHSRFSIQ